MRAKDDPAAREQLIERFLPLIVSLARSYRTEGLDFADLVQEGCVGLLRALDRFDAARGVRQIPLHELAERCGIDAEQAKALLRADAEVPSLSDPVAASDEVGMRATSWRIPFRRTTMSSCWTRSQGNSSARSSARERPRARDHRCTLRG